MAKVGRPTKYNPEYIPLMLEMAEQGKSFVVIAAKIGVTPDTLWDWSNAHDEFRDAYKKAKVLARTFWEDKGMEGAFGQIKGFNPAVWIFWMKARYGWSESGPNDEPQEETDLEFSDE